MQKKEDLLGVWNLFGAIDTRIKPFYGIFWHGMRYLSLWRWEFPGLRVMDLEPLGSPENGIAFFRHYIPFSSSSGEDAGGALSILAERVLRADGFSECLSIKNFGRAHRSFRVRLSFEADFSDMFEVRGFQSSIVHPRPVEKKGSGDHVCLSYQGKDGVTREAIFFFSGNPSGAMARRNQLVWSMTLSPDEEIRIETSLYARDAREGNGEGIRNHHLFPVPEAFSDVLKKTRFENEEKRAGWPAIDSTHPVLPAAYERAIQDLEMLMTTFPQGKIPYAGLPWFSTVFGRDALITAYSLLWAKPEIALGVLTYLALKQADQVDPKHAAQPGKILHEERTGELAATGEIPFSRYYGSVDATPLFIVLACEYHRQTGGDGSLHLLWPSILKALDWIDTYGVDSDSGFLVYRADPEGGLSNQGWKDSGDSVVHADGSLATDPIALVEVQGYLFWAWSLLAPIAEKFGDASLGESLRKKSEHLKKRLIERFWLPDRKIFAMAIDGKGHPCAVLSSNPGHLLITGVLTQEMAQLLADTLMGPELFSGWGIRTLGRNEVRYNPVSYHNGSIWPHDNGLIMAGLARYGLTHHLKRLSEGYLDGISHFKDFRMPELICGFGRDGDFGPVLYPTSCSPQTWSVASLFLMIKSLKMNV